MKLKENEGPIPPDPGIKNTIGTNRRTVWGREIV